MKAFELGPDEVVALPVDELALEILGDVVSNDEWNEHNWLNAAAQGGYSKRPDAINALAEAWGWLRRKGLIARKPGQTDPYAMFVTREGHRALNEGPARVRAAELLDLELHPALQRKVRPQFLLGDFELAAFAAMKEVEIRVRKLTKAGESDIGVKLMRRALGKGGALRDTTLTEGEQDARSDLFAGAIGAFKNPSSHREVDYSNAAEAAEVILLADLLMRLLDRIQKVRLRDSVRKGKAGLGLPPRASS